ncbi:hypothetical protein NC653_024775 [Populus alba x Populus x berolinensis]|uniref:Uncharacterized protein n=1 Tax=Populus alba x Populus x berolinensis TaxID=444605 RepID=A0AAD6M9N3_9ROSI|nr:hypothetical protein NC653_024775 [Populus alba x Populus x berolinensis]
MHGKACCIVSAIGSLSCVVRRISCLLGFTCTEHMVEIVKYFSVVVHIEGGGLALWFCSSLLADNELCEYGILILARWKERVAP